MTRREAAWLVARASATVAGQQFLRAWPAHEHHSNENDSNAPPEPDRWTNYRPQFFSPEDYEAVRRFTEILIPTDDTPGAREAHVGPFIDFILFSASEFAPETQQHWRQAIAVLRDGKFGTASAGDQVAIVKQMSDPHDANFQTFQLIKDLTVYSFYTSRAGLIDNLGYKGLAYLTEFPGCSHPEHRTV